MKALVLVAMLGFSAPAAGQLVSQVPRGNVLKPEIDRARRHYEAGWQLYRHEDWMGALKEFEQAYIRHVLQQAGGSQTKAAAALGISRKALWEKRRRYGIP